MKEKRYFWAPSVCWCQMGRWTRPKSPVPSGGVPSEQNLAPHPLPLQVAQLGRNVKCEPPSQPPTLVSRDERDIHSRESARADRPGQGFVLVEFLSVRHGSRAECLALYPGANAHHLDQRRHHRHIPTAHGRAGSPEQHPPAVKTPVWLFGFSSCRCGIASREARVCGARQRLI